MTITHTRFAEYSARIAKIAADWTADALLMREWAESPMAEASLRRYLADLRHFTDQMDPDKTGAE